MTSDPIRAAVEQLQASVEALPERERPWKSDGTLVVLADDWDAHVADCIGDTTTAEYIARTASPHVTEALVRHLAVIDRETPFESDAEMERWAIAVQESASALAEAITHRSGT